MQLELQGFDMSQIDPEMQQQLLMGMDPMMMYGEEEEEEGDQWLPPDAAFLQQHMQGQAPWSGGGGVVFAANDHGEYNDYYPDEGVQKPTWGAQQQGKGQEMPEMVQEEGQEEVQQKKEQTIRQSPQQSPQQSPSAGKKHGSPTKNKIVDTTPLGNSLENSFELDESIDGGDFELDDEEDDDDAGF